ncbi:MAG: hypothetical protein IPJ88_17380 [Myxococcales bacterium]|nr:MAG: hypothetical protein IPJ88_17380 [Myxococcales bacterium]
MRLLCLWVAALLMSCAGSLDNKDQFQGDGGSSADTGTDTGTVPNDAGTTPMSLCNLASPAQVITDSCLGAGCHDNGVIAPDLSGTTAYATFVDQDVTRSGCTGEKYIDSTNPENSFLYKIVVAGSVCGNGLMPPSPNEGVLDANDADNDAALKDCLKDWVTELASGAN